MANQAPVITGDAPNPQLLDQSQPALLSLVGYAAVYYHWADGLAPFAVAGAQVVGELVSTPGFEWQELPLSQHTIKLTETPKDSRHGVSYQLKLQGDKAQAPANVLAALESMTRRPVVVALRQHDGQLRVVGSPEAPLTLLPTGTGQNPATRSGIDVLFTGLATHLAPFYTGTLLVAGANAGAVVATGSFRVLDGHGELRLVVPAGYDLVVQGPFKTELLLQSAG